MPNKQFSVKNFACQKFLRNDKKLVQCKMHEKEVPHVFFWLFPIISRKHDIYFYCGKERAYRTVQDIKSRMGLLTIWWSYIQGRI